MLACPGGVPDISSRAKMSAEALQATWVKVCPGVDAMGMNGAHAQVYVDLHGRCRIDAFGVGSAGAFSWSQAVTPYWPTVLALRAFEGAGMASEELTETYARFASLGFDPAPGGALTPDALPRVDLRMNKTDDFSGVMLALTKDGVFLDGEEVAASAADPGFTTSLEERLVACPAVTSDETRIMPRTNACMRVNVLTGSEAAWSEVVSVARVVASFEGARVALWVQRPESEADTPALPASVRVSALGVSVQRAVVEEVPDEEKMDARVTVAPDGITLKVGLAVLPGVVGCPKGGRTLCLIDASEIHVASRYRLETLRELALGFSKIYPDDTSYELSVAEGVSVQTALDVISALWTNPEMGELLWPDVVIALD